MENRTKDQFTSAVNNTVRSGYEGKVIAEAFNRAGNNPQLKGIIHEILIKDGINANPLNIIKGINAQLTQSTNAKTVDVVVKQGGKIISRIQAKDTPASVGKVVSQIKSGQYNSAKIFGTKETVQNIGEKLTKEGIKKTVTSSGISTNTTSALAAKAGVNGLSGIGNACKTAAKGSAFGGAAISAGITAICEIKSVIDGEHSIGEAAGSVAKSASIGAISAAAGSAAGTFAGGAIATGLTTIGATGVIATGAVVLTPIAVTIGVGIGICSFIKSIFDN